MTKYICDGCGLTVTEDAGNEWTHSPHKPIEVTISQRKYHLCPTCHEKVTKRREVEKRKDAAAKMELDAIQANYKQAQEDTL